jgi:hypothetical protein
MPRGNELPETLRWLALLEATKVRSGRDFRIDIDHLAEQLSRHVDAKSGERGAAADLWDELKLSENLDALERFVESFNNTRESYDARGRLKQLKQVLEIRERMEAWYRLDEIPDEDQAAEDFFFETLQLVDDFLDAPSTEWHAEIGRSSEILRDLAKDSEPYLGFCYDYDQYHEERRLKGKPNRR